MPSFGDKIRELREKRGLGVNQLGMKSGVSPSLISKIENNERGVPKLDTLKKLSVGLRMDYREFLKQTDLSEHFINEKGGVIKEPKATYESKQPEVEEYYRHLADKYKIDIHDPANRERLEKLVRLFFEEYNKDK